MNREDLLASYINLAFLVGLGDDCVGYDRSDTDVVRPEVFLCVASEDHAPFRSPDESANCELKTGDLGVVLRVQGEFPQCGRAKVELKNHKLWSINVGETDSTAHYGERGAWVDWFVETKTRKPERAVSSTGMFGGLRSIWNAIKADGASDAVGLYGEVIRCSKSGGNPAIPRRLPEIDFEVLLVDIDHGEPERYRRETINDLRGKSFAQLQSKLCPRKMV